MSGLPEPVSRKSGSCISGQGGLTRSLPEPPFFVRGAAALPPGGGPALSAADLVFEHLPRGREQATSIAKLAAATGLSDREVRAAIEELVNVRRVPVCTLPTNPGVFIATCPEDVDLADAHLRAKAMALLHRRRSLRLCREYLAWRPTIFEMQK